MKVYITDNIKLKKIDLPTTDDFYTYNYTLTKTNINCMIDFEKKNDKWYIKSNGVVSIYDNGKVVASAIINDYSNFFYNVDKYNINICYLPTNFEELLNDDVGKLKFSQLKKCVFAGGYLNYNALNKLGKMKEKIIQVYGQTEQSGYISQCKYKDMKKIDLAFSDLLYISFLNADDNELCDIEGLTFFLKFRYSNPSVYTLNHLKRKHSQGK